MSKLDENFKEAVSNILLEQGKEKAIEFLTARHFDANDYLFTNFGIGAFRDAVEESDIENVKHSKVDSVIPVSRMADEPMDEVIADIDTTKDIKHKHPFTTRFKRIFS